MLYGCPYLTFTDTDALFLHKNISCNKSDGEEGDTNNKLAFYCLTKCVLTGQDKVPKKENIWDRLH